MELAIRKTARLKADGELNPVGEIICICPNGHPWTTTERQLFDIVTIPDSTPQWVMNRLRTRSLRLASVKPAYSSSTDFVAALVDRANAKPNRLTELGRHALFMDQFRIRVS